MTDREWPVVVVGAGAAGILAAVFAARAGVPVLVLETRARPGAKIRVSGGGRCNVLPSRLELEDFHTGGSPKTLRNVLLSWPLDQVRSFFEEDLGVALEVEDTGKVFPRSNDAREVVDALLGALERSGATLRAPFRVVDVERSGRGFEVRSEEGERVRCRRLVLATGGLSLPKTGSDGGGLRISASLGHALAPTYPALVPLLTPEPTWTNLAGVSLRVTLTAARGARVLEERTGDLLFTHRGFSGPVALDVSHHLARLGAEDVHLFARFDPGEGRTWDEVLLEPGPGPVLGRIKRRLPTRVATSIAALAQVSPELRVSEMTREVRKRLVDRLERCRLEVSGNEGYRTAEVTGGGVPLADVRTKTLESRAIPGLYFCGEILDATGRIGGFNFLWAWVTGRKVGRAVAAAGPQ